jgi:hypothetical protein
MLKITGIRGKKDKKNGKLKKMKKICPLLSRLYVYKR